MSKETAPEIPVGFRPAYLATFEAKRVNRLSSKAREGKEPEAYLYRTSRTFSERNAAGQRGSRAAAERW